MISFFEKSIQNQNATPTQNLDFEGLVNGVKKHWSETLTKFYAQCFEGGFKYGGEGYKRLKLQLPYFTPHGSFSTRKNAGLKKLSGFFLFDFDLQDNQNISPLVVREKLEADKFTRFLFRSPSGGLKFFVEYEERTLKNVEDFLEYYKQVVRYFEGRYRIKLDTSQGKLSQPCFISFDEGAFVNTESKKFFLSRVLTEEEKNQPQPKQDACTDSVFRWIEGILEKKKFFLRRVVGTNMYSNLLA